MALVLQARETPGRWRLGFVALVVAVIAGLVAIPAVDANAATLVDCDAGDDLQAAVTAASPTAVLDVIGTCTGVVSISKPLTLAGAGPAQTILDGGGGRPLNLISASNVTIKNMTITGGVGNPGGGARVLSSTVTFDGVHFIGHVAQGEGGAIYASASTLTIISSRFEANTAQSKGGAIALVSSSSATISNTAFINNSATSRGGAIYASPATLTITSSELSENSGSQGGAIDATTVSLTITNSTLANNTSTGIGGAIAINGGSLSVTASTISGNSADTLAGGVRTTSTSLSIASSVLAGNVAPSSPDCSASVISNGYNVVGVGCGTLADGVNNDQVGTSGSPLDPMLSAIALHNGSTRTLAPLPGSPVVDAVPPGSCAVAADQRSVARPQGPGCDIGSFEGRTPVAAADAFDATEDTILDVAAPGVLSNDSDPDGQAITAVLDTQATGGSVTLAPDGSFTYEPDAHASGSDSFTYHVTDGGTPSSTVTVTITIAPVADEPVTAVSDAAGSEDQSIPVTLSAGLVDTDGSETLEVIVSGVGDGATLSAGTDQGGGSWSLQPGELAGLAYLPAPDWSGVDGLSMVAVATETASGGTASSAPKALSVTVAAVADEPTVSVEPASGLEDQLIPLSIVPAAADIDGSESVKIVISGVPATASITPGTHLGGGAFELAAGDIGDAALAPPANLVEVVHLTVTPIAIEASNGDEASGAPEQLTVTINGVNDAPTWVPGGGVVVGEDAGSVSIPAWASAISAGPSDESGQAMEFVVIANSNPGLFETGPAVDASDGRLTFMTASNAHGSATIDFVLVDDGGTDNGGQNTSAPGQLSIIVNSVNDAPVTQPDGPFAVDEGGQVSGDVSVNDSDADGDELTFEVVAEPDHGLVVMDAGGAFTYDHDGSETATDAFTYRVWDSTVWSAPESVTISVSGVNDPPTVIDGTGTVDEGASFAGAVSGLGSDPDGDTLTFEVVAAPSSGTVDMDGTGTFDYDHDGSETVSDTFTFRAWDGMVWSSPAQMVITVNPTNDSPTVTDGVTAVDEGASVVGDVGPLGSDVDGDPLVFEVVTDAALGSVAMDGSGAYAYTHDGSETTEDRFTFRAWDGTVWSSPAEVVITVNPVNDAPLAVADGPFTVDEGNVLSADVSLNDSDPEDDPLVFEVVSPVAHGSLGMNAAGGFTYTHDGSETTGDSFTYRAWDGAAWSATVVVTIAITPVNDVPAAMAGSITVAEGGSVADVLTASDPDGDGLSFSVVAGASHGVAVIDTDGLVVYTHDGSETLTDLFTFRVWDGAAWSSPAQVEVTVNPVNDAPVAGADGPFAVTAGSILQASSLLANDTDAEGDTLSVVVTAVPTAGSLVVATDGSFTYTANGDGAGTDAFTYVAHDGTTSSNAITVTIVINPIIDPTIRTQLGWVDTSQGQWHLLTQGRDASAFFFGNPGDYPIFGDWDCDGVATPGMYRQSDGFVYLRNSNTQGVADVRFFFGDPGDVPLAGDFNGDGCDTVSIYRPAEGRFFIINKLGADEGGLGAAEIDYFFGDPGDKPFVGDFDGDGVVTVGLHRESTGLVYFRQTHTTGVADAQFIFGDPGDRIVAGDWNANGVWSPALFRPDEATTYLRYTNTAGNADETVQMGASTWVPVSGKSG